MKLKSVFICVCLSMLVNLLGFNPNLTFNTTPALAQEVAAFCPLDANIAATFEDSKCEAVTLEQPQTFYRYYSSSSNKYGRYLTTDKYTTNVDVINNLALNQDWGNQATMMLEVTVPAGTTVYEGIVAPQISPLTLCYYPGGSQQTFIMDSRDPNIKWSEVGNLTVKDFTCSQ
jgi:hypothetical protein